jgi:hypothetical protein
MAVVVEGGGDALERVPVEGALGIADVQPAVLAEEAPPEGLEWAPA